MIASPTHPEPPGGSFSARRLAEARAESSAAVAKLVGALALLFCPLCVYLEQSRWILVGNLLCVGACVLLYRRARRGYTPVTDRAISIAVMATLLGDSAAQTQVATLALYTPVVLYVLCAEPSPRWRAGLLAAAATQVVAVLAYIGYVGPAYALDSYHVASERVHCLVVGFVSAILIWLYRRLSGEVRAINEAHAAELAARVAASRAAAEEVAAGAEAYAATSAEVEASVGLQRRAQAALAATREQLEQFGNAASHDLKEPLRTIRAFTQLLRREATSAPGTDPAPVAAPEEDQALAEHFAHVDAACGSMQTLLERLLLYQRASAAQEGDLAPEAVSVEALWRGALAEELPRGHPYGEVATSFATEPDAPPEVYCDRRFATMALGELLRNALIFHDGSRGVREVGCEVRRGRDGLLHVGVRDNGIGIAPAYREQVFGMFKRLHPREVYPGAGLGLPLVRRIAEAAGGRAWVEAAGDEESAGAEGTAGGGGTVAWVSLPTRQ